MPDAKSLLPGRAFRSEHAQLRPEPHSIASHGPAPMDPLQTTRMRNGVLYAAEWPCCHDPLRLSLGSEDPFYQTTHAFGARGCATPPPLFGCGGGRARRARRVRAPPPRAGRRAPNALPKLLPPLPQQPRRRARSQAPARAGLPRKHTGVSFPSHHAKFLPPLPQQPRRRARSQAPARAGLPRKHTGVSFHSHHAAPGPSLNPTPPNCPPQP